MSDDRSDEPKRLGTEDADAALTDRRSVAGALQPSSKPAIRGSSDGRDAALRSDTDRSDASSGTVEAEEVADRLGGGEGRGPGMSGAGAGTGDASAGRSSSDPGEPDEERAAASIPLESPAGVPDAGSPGGMGGAGASGRKTGRPPGGESPGKRSED